MNLKSGEQKPPQENHKENKLQINKNRRAPEIYTEVSQGL